MNPKFNTGSQGTSQTAHDLSHPVDGKTLVTWPFRKRISSNIFNRGASAMKARPCRHEGQRAMGASQKRPSESRRVPEQYDVCDPARPTI